MKLSKLQIELIALITILYCLVIVAGFYNYNKFLYQPLIIKKDKIASENEILSESLRSLQNLKEEDMVLENIRLQQDYQQLEHILPVSAKIPETILFLYTTAKDTGIELISLSHEGDVQKEDRENDIGLKGVEAVDFTLEVKGSFNSLLAFMAQVEDGPRIYSAKYFKNDIKSDDGAEIRMVYTTYFENTASVEPE